MKNKANQCELQDKPNPLAIQNSKNQKLYKLLGELDLKLLQQTVVKLFRPQSQKTQRSKGFYNKQNIKNVAYLPKSRSQYKPRTPQERSSARLKTLESTEDISLFLIKNKKAANEQNRSITPSALQKYNLQLNYPSINETLIQNDSQPNGQQV